MRARRLAAEVGGEAWSLPEFRGRPRGAEVLLLATAAPEPVLGRAGVPVQCAEFVPALLTQELENLDEVTHQSITRMITTVEAGSPDVKLDFPGLGKQPIGGVGHNLHHLAGEFSLQQFQYGADLTDALRAHMGAMSW